MNTLLLHFLTTIAEGSFWLPPQASTTAGDVDWVFYFILWVSVFFTILVTAACIWFVIRFRSKKTAKAVAGEYNTALEVGWTAVPVVLCAVMFYFGLTGYVSTQTAPNDTYDINVTGESWAWKFTYPDGTATDTLHVPIHRPVRLVMTSKDLVYGLSIPAFRIKQDVVPGRSSEQWFEATQDGEFKIFCTKFCGAGDMLAKVVVHPEGGFEQWLAENGDIHASKTPVEAGAFIVKRRGCTACHSIDGSTLAGPTWKGIWGRTEHLTDGTTIKVDEKYIHDSILTPQAQVVEGFGPIMPSFQGMLNDRDINAIIEYLKTVK